MKGVLPVRMEQNIHVNHAQETIYIMINKKNV